MLKFFVSIISLGLASYALSFPLKGKYKFGTNGKPSQSSAKCKSFEGKWQGHCVETREGEEPYEYDETVDIFQDACNALSIRPKSNDPEINILVGMMNYGASWHRGNGNQTEVFTWNEDKQVLFGTSSVTSGLDNNDKIMTRETEHKIFVDEEGALNIIGSGKHILRSVSSRTATSFSDSCKFTKVD